MQTVQPIVVNFSRRIQVGRPFAAVQFWISDTGLVVGVRQGDTFGKIDRLGFAIFAGVTKADECGRLPGIIRGSRGRLLELQRTELVAAGVAIFGRLIRG